MIKTYTAKIIVAAFGLLLFGMLFLMFAPQSASAAISPNAFLGGGNALSRATLGQSQGLTNANPASDLLARLTFAGTHGGRAEEVPPENGEENNSGGNVGAGGVGSPGNPAPNSVSSNGEGNNGGALAGNGGDGGNGGNASPGGLVRAGDVVSNATALNVLNVNIVRISSR